MNAPRQRTGAGPAHAATAVRAGWGPTPRSRRSYTARRDGPTMTVLRATAYVLTSLASVAFLVLGGFAAVQYLQLQDGFALLGPVASDDVPTVDGCGTAGPPPGCASAPQPDGGGAP